MQPKNFLKKTRSINDVLHKIDAVTPEDVQRVAKNILH